MERADGGQVGLGQDGDLPGRDAAARHQEDGSPRGWAGEARVQVWIVCILSTLLILNFGPQMALVYRLDAISQGPKNSQIPGTTPSHFPS